ncbi:MAG: hypothetical protein AB7H97_12700 [Pseudobdellovibrionaceae bacterium]
MKKTAKKKKQKKVSRSSKKNGSAGKKIYRRMTVDLAGRLTGPDLRKIAEGILAKAQEISRNLQTEIRKTTKKGVSEVLLRVSPKKTNKQK